MNALPLPLCYAIVKMEKIENEGQTHLVTYKLFLDDMFFSGWPENCAEVCISKTSYADLMCRSSCDLLVIHSQSTITSRRDRMLVYMILYDKADAERSTNKLIGTRVQKHILLSHHHYAHQTATVVSTGTLSIAAFSVRGPFAFCSDPGRDEKRTSLRT